MRIATCDEQERIIQDLNASCAKIEPEEQASVTVDGTAISAAQTMLVAAHAAASKPIATCLPLPPAPERDCDGKIIKKLATKEDLINRAQAYSKRYLKRHPNTKPERLQRIVANKFNIKITK